jgi:transcription initiation factor IIE alpha subunit
MSFAPNAQEFTQLIKEGCHISDKRLVRYDSAYIITNETLHEDMEFMPKKCDNALTVTASGDHPLFCKLYGAKHVTTFDITCNAKIITDIKMAAIQELNVDEYWQLLSSLYKSKTPLSVKNMNKITPHLSNTVNKYLYDMTANKFVLFSKGHNIDSYIERNLRASDFQKLKQLLKKPFDFIWSNAIDLHLVENYDFIHLSNISDYLSYDDMKSVLINMINHTNVGGYILAQQQNRINASILCEQFSQKLKNWELVQSGRLNVLLRTR